MRLPDSRRQIGALFAVLFFVFWILVLLAGADKPPPPGFLWVVLAVAACAVVVYWRIPAYIDWQRTKRRGRYWRVILDGFVAGLIVALPFALTGGEPSVTPRASDYIIWFVIVGCMGVVNSVILYAVSAVAFRARAQRDSSG